MKKINKRLMIAICLILALTALPCGAFGAVRYMPDVTADMSKADYWIDKAVEPDAVLASPEYIKAINQVLYEKALETRDLYNWSETTFDGLAQNAASESSLRGDGQYYARRDIGWWWDEENKKWSSVDAMGHIYNAAIANFAFYASSTFGSNFSICANVNLTTAHTNAAAIRNNFAAIHSKGTTIRYINTTGDITRTLNMSNKSTTVHNNIHISTIICRASS